MTSSEIKEAVINYIQDENAKYALLIDGAWGTGKTYLYENYLAEAIDTIECGKDKRKYNIYISLYGISTLDSLAKQLIVNYMIYVKGSKDERKALKHLVGVIGVASSAFSFSIGSVSVDLSNFFEKIVTNIDVKDVVICFDDLERCTIPINEFFGFTNNLVEHCNCKVIILADENNIGKIYANTNLENKYLTVLTGNRMVVEHIGNGTRGEKKTLDKKADGEITVEEVKKLNEILYSENYLYKDIKEKVIGKTLFYYPVLKDVIMELINGNKKNDGIIQEGKYKTYLVNHINEIVSAFNETENHNLRIIKLWIYAFKKIFSITTKYYIDSKYYEDILGEFLHYSIWVSGALKKNKKIRHSGNYGSQEYVYFEGHEYTHIFRYKFIEDWICREVWDDADLSKDCKLIIKRKERENVDKSSEIHSKGAALTKLKNWYLMEDEEVKTTLACLEKEVKESQYAYYDYSKIIGYLLILQEAELYTGDMENMKKIMIELIRKDSMIQEEDTLPIDFSSEDLRDKYNKIYESIVEERKKRNCEISKKKHEDEDIYRNADSFYDNCCKMEEYYSSHKSFLEYINFEKLSELINASDNEGIYTIRDAFQKVYFMGNLKSYYMADIEGLMEIRKNIMDEHVIRQGGITRKLALEGLSELIKKKLILLDVDEDQL